MREQLYPKARREKDVSGCRWRVDYRLAYDGGGSSWVGYYRTMTGAKVAAWWNVKFASWGGSAVLHHIDTPENPRT